MKTTKDRNRRPPRSAAQLMPFTWKGDLPYEPGSKAGTEADGRDGQSASPGEGSQTNFMQSLDFAQEEPQTPARLRIFEVTVANDVVVASAMPPAKPKDYKVAILLKVTKREDGPNGRPFQAVLLSKEPKIGKVLLRLLKWVMALEWQDADLDIRILRCGLDGVFRIAGTSKGNLASWYLCLGQICQEETERNMALLVRRIRLGASILREHLDAVVMKAFENLEVGRINLDMFSMCLAYAFRGVITLLRKNSKYARVTKSWDPEAAGDVDPVVFDDESSVSDPEAELLAAERLAERVARLAWLVKELRELERSPKEWVRATASYLLQCVAELKLPSVQELADQRGVHPSTARRQLAEVCDLLMRRAQR